MAKGTEEIADALDEVTDDTADTSTAEEIETDETTTSEDLEERRSGAIPYSRFKEVIDQKNALAEQLDEVANSKTGMESSVSDLTDLLRTAQNDQLLLGEIKQLINHEDPDVVEAVRLVDLALKGELPDVDESDLTEEEIEQHQAALLQKQTETLTDELAEQRADLIISRADQTAEKWMSKLPEEYNEDDKRMVSHVWTDLVDWDAVEDNPDILDEVLAETFQEAINQYGQPRGSLYSPDELEIVDDETASEERSPEEELGELINERNYGAMTSSTDKSGRETLSPEVSDDDFTEDLALAMKIANNS